MSIAEYFTNLTTIRIISLIGIGLGIFGIFIFINYNFFGRSKAEDLDTGRILAYPDHTRSVVFGILETGIAGFILFKKLNEIFALDLSNLILTGLYIVGFLLIGFIILIISTAIIHNKTKKKKMPDELVQNKISTLVLVILGFLFTLIILSILIFTKTI